MLENIHYIIRNLDKNAFKLRETLGTETEIEKGLQLIYNIAHNSHAIFLKVLPRVQMEKQHIG